jgi:hypothetical protein
MRFISRDITEVETRENVSHRMTSAKKFSEGALREAENELSDDALPAFHHSHHFKVGMCG